MDELTGLRDRILKGDTAGSIFKSVADDIIVAIGGNTKMELDAMFNAYMKLAESNLKDALKATEEFEQYVIERIKRRNNGTERVSRQS